MKASELLNKIRAKTVNFNEDDLMYTDLAININDIVGSVRSIKANADAEVVLLSDKHWVNDEGEDVWSVDLTEIENVLEQVPDYEAIVGLEGDSIPPHVIEDVNFLSDPSFDVAGTIEIVAGDEWTGNLIRANAEPDRLEYKNILD